MRLKLLTWNSININDGTSYNAYIPSPQMANQSNNPVLVNRANEYPFLSTAQRNASFITINVIIAPAANINTYRETLKKYFFSDLNRHNLVAQDENDSNKQYYRTGIPISMAQEGDRVNSFLINIQTEYPYWQVVTATADSWDITVSGDSDAISNTGNIPVPPVFTITPTVTKTKGLKYRRFVTMYNNMSKSFNLPLTVRFDTYTIWNAGKMQSEGQDLRVWSDGSYVDRWLGTQGFGADANDCKCWSNYTLSSKQEGTLLSTFDSDDTTIIFSQTRDNLSFLRNLKIDSNTVLCVGIDSDSDNEMVVYDADNIDLINYQITSISRSQKDTVASSHSTSSKVRHIEHDLWVLYGDSDLSAPDVDNRYKPMFDLSASTGNELWYYYNLFDEDSNRPGAWKGEVQSSRTGLSYTYTNDENTFVNPSTNLGLALVGSTDFQVQNESGVLDWLLSHPAGITHLYYIGKKYRTGSWPAIVGLQYLQPGAVWFTSTNETQPSAAYTWESLSQDVSLSSPYPETIRFAIDGLLSSVIGEAALFQVGEDSDGDTDVEVSFDSDNIPSILVGSENNINFFDFTLKNNTTGEYIKVTTPCKLNTSLTIDCLNKIAYLADGSPVNVTLSTDRDDWLNLSAGTNNLEYDDVGTAGVNIVITHRDRVL